MAEPQIRFCTSDDGTRIAYATMGDGPPLVRVSRGGGGLELIRDHEEAEAFYRKLSQGADLSSWSAVDRVPRSATWMTSP